MNGRCKNRFKKENETVSWMQRKKVYEWKYKLLAFGSFESIAIQRWKKVARSLHHFSSSFTHFLCSIFFMRLIVNFYETFLRHYFEPLISVTNLNLQRRDKDKETLNKLYAIRDFSRRAVNCTIMVSYISLLLTGRHHAQQKLKGQMRFFTPLNRNARWEIETIFFTDYSFCCVFKAFGICNFVGCFVRREHENGEVLS